MSAEFEKVYGQLLWVERRRQRVIAAVGSHFGRPIVDRVLRENGVSASPGEEAPFRALIDERGAALSLRSVAEASLRAEAVTIKALRAHVSVYQHNVDEQILFGVRTAGQEAARAFMARISRSARQPERLEIPEAIQAIAELTFDGLPGERNSFLSLRAHGGSTVHYLRSPYLPAWREAGGDPIFLLANRREWFRGLLDILSPETEYSPSRSLEEGSPFGLAQFYQRGTHAGP